MSVLFFMNLAGYRALLTIQYWFTLRPFPMPRSWIIGLDIFFGLYIIAGIIFSVMSRRVDPQLSKRLRRFSRVFWTLGLVGYGWILFSFEEAVFLGARFWFLFILASTAVWCAFILLDIKKNLARERSEQAERERFQKYLPKRK